MQVAWEETNNETGENYGFRVAEEAFINSNI